MHSNLNNNLFEKVVIFSKEYAAIYLYVLSLSYWIRSTLLLQNTDGIIIIRNYYFSGFLSIFLIIIHLLPSVDI